MRTGMSTPAGKTSLVRISVSVENILLDNSVVRVVFSVIETLGKMLIERTVDPYVFREKVKTVKTE